MPRPIEAVIHQQALTLNLEQARRASTGAKVFAVVKANAYGHGIERVFDALKGADGFALLDIEEARRLRGLGWRGPILLLEGCFEPADLASCAELDLWHVVHQERQIAWLAMHDAKRPHHVFLKLNSGMNRLGLAPKDYRAAYRMLQSMPSVESISLMTHFSDADGGRGIDHQVATFEDCTAHLPGWRSVSNSAAILRHRERSTVRGDWVRAGIMTYGSSPDFPHHDAAAWKLHPTMTLRSRVIAVQDVAAGESVGYGSSFVASNPMRLGIVACGYADGYPRHAPHGTPVLVDGAATSTVGRVSMDMLAVDLTEMPQSDAGSEVTLWGVGPNGRALAIDVVAQSAGTIAYELMCALAARVPVRIEEATAGAGLDFDVARRQDVLAA